MCGCRKNKGVTDPPSRSLAPVRSLARAVAPARSVAPVQQREVVTIQRRNHRRNGIIETRSISLKPLEVLDTAIWGPSVWRILHAAADKAHPKLAAALRALDGALPCPDCRGHYHAWLQSHPLPEGGGQNRPALPIGGDLRTWLLDLHNDVNVRTGKAPWTIADLSATATVDVAGALATLQGRIGVDGWRALAALV